MKQGKEQECDGGGVGTILDRLAREGLSEGLLDKGE